jgi:hypothetical protein
MTSVKAGGAFPSSFQAIATASFGRITFAAGLETSQESPMTYRNDLPEWNPDRRPGLIDAELEDDPSEREGRDHRLGIWVTGLVSAFIVFMLLYGRTRDPRPEVEQEVAKQSVPAPAAPIPATRPAPTTGQGAAPQTQGP